MPVRRRPPPLQDRRAVLDSAVLVPPLVATTLLHSAAAGRFDARWSDLILHDAEEHAIRTDPSGRPDGARRRFALLQNEAFADNLVPDREVDDALRYVPQHMPDPEDRHDGHCRS